MTTKITEQNISELANIGVNWQSVFTGDGSTGLTAVAGRGYFIDTTSGTVTVTLPASPSAGDVVVLKDYARTWNTNNVTLTSTTFDGVSNNPSFSTNGQTVTLVYMDGTKGWSLINEDTTTGLGASYITATGGTVTESGDYKIHTFTGDGCFVVSSVGNPSGSTSVDYLVVAGGGGGAGAAPGSGGRGGGGAGGFRMSNSTCMPAPLTSPLAASCGITVSATTYPVTVGAGGSGGTNACVPSGDGTKGSDSVFSTITSTGGGRGNAYPHTCSPGGCASQNGGSGGGGYSPPGEAQGAGNTPPTTPPQGNPALNIPASPGGGAGGGGAGASPPATVPNSNSGSAGGIGSYVLQTGFAGCNGTTGPVGSTRYFAGGGGGGSYLAPGTQASGGDGGGGDGGNGDAPFGATCGTTNTGGGGGGGGGGASGGAGGKGIVIIRYKFQ